MNGEDEEEEEEKEEEEKEKEKNMLTSHVNCLEQGYILWHNFLFPSTTTR